MCMSGADLGENAGGAHPTHPPTPPSPHRGDLRFSTATGILRKKKKKDYVVYWC